MSFIQSCSRLFPAGMFFALTVCISGQRICTAEDEDVGQSQPRFFLEFNGRHFYLAYISNKEEQILKEYIPAGENLEHWNEMMSVRVFPKFPKGVGVNKYMQGMDESIRASDPANRCEIIQNEKTGQNILDFLMWAKEPEFFAELNLMQVSYVDNQGLVVCQYANRLYIPDPDKVQAEELGMKIRVQRETMRPLFEKADFEEKQEQPNDTPKNAAK